MKSGTKRTKTSKPKANPVSSATIDNAYAWLWKAFSDAAAEERLMAHYERQLKNATDEDGPIFSALLYLPGWPYKRGAKSKKLDIVAQVNETFSVQKPEIVKSTVQIGYFRVNDAESLLQMHYDYDETVDTAHPIFHAQLGDTDWPLDSLKKMGCEKLAASSADNLKAARIPTAFMGFGQLLLLLAADYLEAENYVSLLTALRRSDSVTWSAVCPALRTSLTKGGYLHSHHWYCEPAASAAP